MEARFTVGEFAKLHGMKKQTLIFYDNIDLFKPKIVDKNNGYRYYTSDQLEILDGILILREIGIPLKEIKEFLKNRDNEKTLNLLNQQREKLNKQKEHIENIIKRLDKRIKIIEDFNSYESDIAFKYIEEDYLAIEEVKSPYQLLQTDIALKKLLKKAMDREYTNNYQIGTMIAKENLIKEDFLTATYVFTPVEKNLKNAKVFIKARGLYVVGYHKGQYKDIGNTYKKIIDKLEKNNYRISGYSYEYGILDSLTSANINDYITRIEIPIELIK